MPYKPLILLFFPVLLVINSAKGFIMKARNVMFKIIITSALMVLFSSCGAANYVKSELTGTAKPVGGIQEVIPTTKKFQTSPSSLRTATLEVLNEQGYIYTENPSTGTIRTDSRPLDDQAQSGLLGAIYSAKIFIRLKESSITYTAKFDEKSNVTIPEENITYPEKENELRKIFFDSIAAKINKQIR